MPLGETAIRGLFALGGAVVSGVATFFTTKHYVTKKVAERFEKQVKEQDERLAALEASLTVLEGKKGSGGGGSSK